MGGLLAKLPVAVGSQPGQRRLRRSARSARGLFERERWLAKKAESQDSGRRIGIGDAFELTPEGASFPGSMPSGFETSMVTIDPTGMVRVAISVTSPGSGNETGIAQLVADVFGVHPDRVAVTQGDTDITPFGGGNTSSRSLMFGGAASVLAARELRDRVAICTATLLQAEHSQIEFVDGKIVVNGDADRSLPFEKAVSTIYTQAYSTAIDVELPLQVTSMNHALKEGGEPSMRIDEVPARMVLPARRQTRLPVFRGRLRRDARRRRSRGEAHWP